MRQVYLINYIYTWLYHPLLDSANLLLFAAIQQHRVNSGNLQSTHLQSIDESLLSCLF
jgi:hypothetical protein